MPSTFKNLETILVSTDLGPGSDQVVRAAAALAKLTDARLHVLHTYEFQSAPYMDDVPAATFQARIAQVRAALDAQIERVVRGVDVASRDVMIYTAYKAILERAEQTAADLIVIGRHRGSGFGDAFLGSTADHVVRSAAAPCLIVHGPLSVPLTRVLVPIDLSEPALHALDVALAWVSSLGAADTAPEIIVLHVIPRVYDFEDVPVDSGAVGSRMHHEIEAARTRAGVPTTLQMREDVRWGDDPVAEIVDYIIRESIDMVVLGTHGYGALKRALLGSVASGVARSAACPVLLVPPALGSTQG
jgi:nucleotide-binding universal stress UspA family protein